MQHPLNHARRLILVPALGFVHVAYTFVRLHLRLDREVLHVLRLPVPIGQGLTEHVDGFEFAAARMIVPHIIDGPKVIFADHRPNALDGWNRGSHASFGIESVRSSASAGIAQLATWLPFRRVNLPRTLSDVI